MESGVTESNKKKLVPIKREYLKRENDVCIGTVGGTMSRHWLCTTHKLANYGLIVAQWAETGKKVEGNPINALDKLLLPERIVSCVLNYQKTTGNTPHHRNVLSARL